MRVTFWGVRGSIPTPGPSTVRYGGNSVCVEARLADGTIVIFDAGTGIRELGKHLLANEEHRSTLHLLITHAHWDHMIGLPFFGPLYRKDAQVMMHPVTELARERSRNPIVFDGVHFPVRFKDLPAQIDRTEHEGVEFQIGSARVRHIELNHPGGATGFRLDDEDGASLCYLTDNELSPPGAPLVTPAELARFAEGTGLLIHDAQYLPAEMLEREGWGHSTVPEVLALGKLAGARTLALHHHDPERDDDALDAIADEAEIWAQGSAPSMKTFVAREGLLIVV